MGYYTMFTLEINTSDGMDVMDYIHELEQGVIGYNPFDDRCKWYGHKEDMIKFSKLYPKVLFTVSGEGEENSDIWKEHFYDGKSQYCKALIIHPSFDATQLK
jgi:hypothetical protein